MRPIFLVALGTGRVFRPRGLREPRTGVSSESPYNHLFLFWSKCSIIFFAKIWGGWRSPISSVHASCAFFSSIPLPFGCWWSIASIVNTIAKRCNIELRYDPQDSISDVQINRTQVCKVSQEDARSRWRLHPSRSNASRASHGLHLHEFRGSGRAGRMRAHSVDLWERIVAILGGAEAVGLRCHQTWIRIYSARFPDDLNNIRPAGTFAKDYSDNERRFIKPGSDTEC